MSFGLAGIAAAAKEGVATLEHLVKWVVDAHGNTLAHTQTRSLAEFTKITNCEPITVVSFDLTNTDILRQLLNSVLSNFIGYYLQAVDILTKVNNVEVIRVLDKLSVDRDATAYLQQLSREDHGFVSLEGYSLRLPTQERPTIDFALEARVDDEKLLKEYSDATATLKGLAEDFNSPRSQQEQDIFDSALNDTLDAFNKLDPLVQDYFDKRKQSAADDQAKFARDAGQREHEFYRKISQDLTQYRQARTDKQNDTIALKKIDDELKRKLEIDSREFQREMEKNRRDFERDKSNAQTLSNARPNLGKTNEDLHAIVDLSIGKLVNVSVVTTNEKGFTTNTTLPISFRLKVRPVPNQSIVAMMKYKGSSTSFSDRLLRARAGEIRYIQDLIFCQDLIDEYKRAVIMDKTRTLQEIVTRASNAKKYGVLTNNPSLVSASSIFIISSDVANQVSYALGGKLSDNRVLKSVFNATFAMMLVVVNKEWEQVDIYIRDVPKPATFSFRELQAKSRGAAGADITDILRAIQENKPPRF